METHTPEQPSSQLSPWFVYTVGGLLLVIIAALTGLSLRLHANARQLQADVDRLHRSHRANAAALLGADPSMFRPTVAWDRLPRGTAVIDGQSRPVMLMEPVLADYLGLSSGDVIIVESHALDAQTQPAELAPE